MGNEREENINSAQNNLKKKKPFINTSGQGANAKVPFAVSDKFNWGAFLLSWIWGIGNKTYITLINIILFFIPLVNLGVAIWFGIKGNEWAWRNKHFDGIKQFHENQKKWAIAGVIFSFIFIPIMCILLIFGTVFSVAKDSINNLENNVTTSTNNNNYSRGNSNGRFNYYANNKNFEERSTIRKSFSELNQALSTNYAFNGKFANNPSDFMSIFTTRLIVFPDKTTNNSFATPNGNYTLIPLRERCITAGSSVTNAVESDACAKVTVNNKYTFYLYSDQAIAAKNSKEANVLYKVN